MAGNDSGPSSGSLGFIPEQLRERALWAILAFALGTGGAFSYLQMDPPRPDPWTGTDDKERMERFEKEIKEYVGFELRPLQEHVQTSEFWKARVRDMERQVTLLNERVEAIRNEHRGWRYQLKMLEGTEQIKEGSR